MEEEKVIIQDDDEATVAIGTEEVLADQAENTKVTDDVIDNNIEETVEEPMKVKIPVTGEWDVTTTMKAQEVFGVDVGGLIANQPYSVRQYLPNAFTASWEFKTEDYDGGSELVKAIQEKIEVAADGHFGLETVRKFQLFLGTTITGRMEEETVKAFQEWLNKQ